MELALDGYGSTIFELADRDPTEFFGVFDKVQFVSIASQILELAGKPHADFGDELFIYEDLVVRIIRQRRNVEICHPCFRNQKLIEEVLTVRRVATAAVAMRAVTQFSRDGKDVIQPQTVTRYAPDHGYLHPHMKGLLRRLVLDEQTVYVND